MSRELEDHELLNQYTDSVRSVQRAQDYAITSDMVFRKQKGQKMFSESLLRKRDEEHQRSFDLGNEILRRMRQGGNE